MKCPKCDKEVEMETKEYKRVGIRSTGYECKCGWRRGVFHE